MHIYFLYGGKFEILHKGEMHASTVTWGGITLKQVLYENMKYIKPE
jgi:hypothetical protein